MSLARKVKGTVLVTIGYLLSPLSWWNDAYINIPIAYVFASALSLLIKGQFEIIMIGFYWISNVVGFVIMHVGARKMAAEGQEVLSREIVFDLVISLVYTLIVAILVQSEIIRFPTEYFR